MNISSINSLSPINLNSEQSIKVNNDKSFENMLNNAISGVNKEQIEGYNAMEGIATGKVSNLQEAVQQIEEAELSLKLGLEVKNKAINAYKEVMRMQI
jgi:flagellar hook-basal body complex protein FliE